MKHMGMRDNSTPDQLDRRKIFVDEGYGGKQVLKSLTWWTRVRAYWYITVDPVIRFVCRLGRRLTGQVSNPDMSGSLDKHLWRGEHEVEKGRQTHVILDNLQSDVQRTKEGKH